MKIVIDIPDDIYSAIVKQYRKDKELQTRDNLYKAIVNGTPIPKGHGDLIDRKELLKQPIDDANYPSNYVRIAKAIIEADKEV